MTKNLRSLITQKTYLTLQNIFYENLYTKEEISQPAINQLLNKIPINKKISNEHFRLCEADISLEEILNAIN